MPLENLRASSNNRGSEPSRPSSLRGISRKFAFTGEGGSADGAFATPRAAPGTTPGAAPGASGGAAPRIERPAVAGPEDTLIVWAGDQAHVAPDFVAVVDFNQRSVNYGKVLSTVPLTGPNAIGNEPHHLGLSVDDKTPALGGLLSVLRGQDQVFFFDVSHPRDPVFLSSNNPPMLRSPTSSILSKMAGFLRPSWVNRMGQIRAGWLNTMPTSVSCRRGRWSRLRTDSILTVSRSMRKTI